MWLVLGVSAIITAIMNIVWTLKHKDAKWVSNEDWSALMDVAPTMSGILWCLVPASIIINSISLFNKK